MILKIAYSTLEAESIRCYEFRSKSLFCAPIVEYTDLMAECYIRGVENNIP